MAQIDRLSHKIEKKARRMGFQLVGTTTPEPPAHLDVYQSWLQADHHAGMGWMARQRNRERRADPRLILPECRSILVLGAPYQPSPPVEEGRKSEGNIACYAWGDDYHDVLPDRLQALVTFIEKQVGPPVANRWYTDTGPILERELAQRAGLGWIGKNTNLIDPRWGSYFFLAEILLNLPLAPDAPFTEDRCGSCTRCIEACPTGCILPNRTIDANRCISYLTIELKEAIPSDLRPKLGNWIFGCDVCQQVCPWNQRFAHLPEDDIFNPRDEIIAPNLIAEMQLSPEEFNRKFKGSPIKRAKRRGYLRNVAVALGNTGDSSAVPALAQAIQDQEPLIRGHAAWALGQIGGEKAQVALHSAAQTESNFQVSQEIRKALNH